MFRKNLGRFFIIVAGTGCLVVLIFVVLPMMNEPAPQMTQDEIVAEVLGPGVQADVESDQEIAGDDAVMPGPSPLVGVRNDGQEVVVIFPAAESDGEGPEGEEREGEGPEPRAEENDEGDGGFPQILSEEDIAEATAALEGEELEPVLPVEADSSAEHEVAVSVPSEDVSPATVEDMVAAHVVPPASESPGPVVAEPGEVDMDGQEENLEPASVVSTADDEVAEAELEAMIRAMVRAMASEMEKGGTDNREKVVEVSGVRRSEFDVPVSLDSRVRQEVSHPSGGVPETAVPEAAQAGDPEPGLPPQTGVRVPGTLRGVMGYRLPLVGRQEVPDQIVSGVLIPAHTTFVILKAGSWELVDVTPEEVQRLVDAEARRNAPVVEAESVRKGWSPLRIFRKRDAASEE